MGFMGLYTVHMFAYVVDTSSGVDIVPAELVSMKADADDLRQYCEGDVQSFELKRGWFARYSANGYMDCTPWCGPYENREDAIRECKATYGSDDDDDESEES